MTKENLLDQKICNIPFEVVAIYDNGPQILQENSDNNYSPLINVKVRIRNKEDIIKGRHGIISVPKLNTKNWPKRMRLVNSDQTIMSFKLALEPNSDEVQQKSSKRLFQMFRPGGCLSSKRDEDGYSYMPSTSNDLKRKSASGIEDYENNKIAGAFSLKKNNFSSYTNTLKTPKTFLGKCKPGGCLDPPFSEDKYSYKPTVEDVQILPQPAINTNLLYQDLKQENTIQTQKINTLHHETNILENKATLITYPSTLSSSKLKTKGNQNRKSNLRIRSEQMELSKNFTNEFPEAYFIPPKNEKLKQGKSFDKYNCVEKELQIREAYVNKDYIFQSQTPSELLSDAPTITSQSYDEPLPEVIKETIISKELNSIISPLLKAEGVLNNKRSKDNIKTNNTTFTAEGVKKDESNILQDKKSSYNNNIPIMKHISSNIAESKVNSTIKVETVQETSDDTNIKKIKNLNNNSVSEDKNQSNSELRNEISTKSCKSSIDPSSMPIGLLRQHQNVSDKEIDKAEITNVKEQIEVQSELTQSKSIQNTINLVKVKKSRSQEFENVKKEKGQVTSNETIKHTISTKTNYPDTIIKVQNQGDDKKINLDKNVSDQFENISEPTELLRQELEFKNNKNDIMKESIDHKTETASKEIIDIQPFVVSELLPKVSSFNSVDQMSTLKSSYSGLISPKNINIKPEDSLLSSTKSKQSIKEENKTDKHNENENKSFDSLQYSLPSSLIAGHPSSQILEINSKKSGFSMSLHLPEQNFEISSKHEKLDADINVTPVTLSLNYLSRNKNELDNQNNTKSQRTLSITSQIKTSDDVMELDSSTDHKPLYNSMSKKENFYPPISDAKMLMPIQKYDINISKQDILSNEKSRNGLTKSIRSLETLPNSTIHQEPKLGMNKLERKESSSSSQKLDNRNSADKVKLNKDHLSFTDRQFLKDLDKSKSDINSLEKKPSQELDTLQELKIMEPSPQINKSFTYINNIKSISSISINFGFHTSTNDKTRPSIRTFDPSINLENYPQDNIFTIKTILRKNDSEIKMQIDSITDLTMQIKSNKQLNGSRNLATNILNDRRRNNLRVHSSEILINKEQLLQETLKGLYETLIPIEKNIIKLKEEADTLHREHLLLKEVLLSKKIKPYKIVSNIKTCSCLRREIGLE